MIGARPCWPIASALLLALSPAVPGHGASHHGNGSDEPHPDHVSAWLCTIGATCLVMCTAFFILPFVSRLSDDAGQGGDGHKLLRLLTAFAVGGLLGDVFIHILPHIATGSHDHDHSHEHNDFHMGSHGTHMLDEKEHERSSHRRGDGSHAVHHHHGTGEHTHMDIITGLLVLSGIMTFLCVEVMLRHWAHDAGGGGRGPSHGAAKVKQDDGDADGVDRRRGADGPSGGLRSRNKASSSSVVRPTDGSEVTGHGDADARVKEMVGYLNLAADAMHNMTDGLTIASSFLVSQKLGLSTTAAVFFHEVPHNVGDFAILLQNGFSKRKALVAQLASGLGTLVGALIGLLAGEIEGFSNMVLPFTAGGFIYISLVASSPTSSASLRSWHSSSKSSWLGVPVLGSWS